MINESKFLKQEIQSEEVTLYNKYSPSAIRLSNFIYFSNQLPIDPLTGEISSDIRVQTHQVLQNIVALLAEENLQLNNIVKLNIYLTNIDDLKFVDNVYGNYFEKVYPARSVLQVEKIENGALVSMDGQAIDTSDFDTMRHGSKCSGCSGCSKRG